MENSKVNSTAQESDKQQHQKITYAPFQKYVMHFFKYTMNHKTHAAHKEPKQEDEKC